MTTHFEYYMSLLDATSSQHSKVGRVLPGKAYTDTDVFTLDRDVFKSQWVSIGHSADVPEAGSYKKVDLLGVPLVIVRQKDGSIKVLSRTCRHKAMDVLATENERNVIKRFSCPYHKWGYDLNGKLVSAPIIQLECDILYQGLALKEYECKLDEGIIFTRLNREGDAAKPGQMAAAFPQIKNYGLNQLRLVYSGIWLWQANWKIVVENVIEGYHHLGAHSQSLQPIMPAADTRVLQTAELLGSGCSVIETPIVQGEHKRFADPKMLDRDFFPILNDDLVKYGPVIFVMFSFPNTVLVLQPDRLLMYNIIPVQFDQTKILASTYISKKKLSAGQESLLIQEKLDFDCIQEEDRIMCEHSQIGFAAQDDTKSGPLCSLELAISQFYLNIRDSLVALSTGGRA
jgi:phenylpropionate dioxygenase-like ring-hydroxylating dioxygenase large terminal subunit